MSDNKIIVIGYGNPGRLDDGLGPAFAEKIEALALPDVDIDSNYQLNIEDAYLISKYETVLFVDATIENIEAFYCKPLLPIPADSFSSHSIAPGQVLALAQTMFSANVDAHIMGIKGVEFDEFKEKLSTQALQNLDKAVDYFLKCRKNSWNLATTSV